MSSNKNIDCSKYKHIKQAPSQYDNYELQNACDLLVTDYSSVFFDFAVSRRKIVLFQYDQAEYLKDRGVCIPLDELPFPIVQTIPELVKELHSGINYDDKEFLEKYATFDNKNANELLCSHVILGKPLPDSSKEKTIKHNSKKNVFIFTGSLRTRQDAIGFWDYVNKLDFDKANYFLLYYDPVMWKNAYRLLPINDKCNQIGMWSYLSMTKKEAKKDFEYFAKKDLTDENKAFLKKIYQRELIKHFGYGVKADAVILWNCLSPNLANLYDNFCDKKYAVYADGFEIWDLALIDSLRNYKRICYSEFNKFMENEFFKELEEK